MKKAAVFFLIVFAVLCIGNLFGETAFAADKEGELEKELEKETEDNLSGLDLTDFEAFFQELDRTQTAGVGATIREVIKSIIDNKQNFNFNDALNLILKSFASEVLSALPMVISIIIIAVLFGILKGLTSSFSKESTSQIVYFVCYGAIISILGVAISKTVMSVHSALKGTERLLDIVFPMLLTFTAALGGAGSVAVYQPMMAILTTVIIKIINTVIFPLFFASLVFGIVGNLSENVKLSKLTASAKSIAEWILGAVFSLFSIFVTAQGITGAAFDTVAVKTAKFALSSYVPILGGYLSDGFDLALASFVLIKNAVGLTAILLIFFVIAIPLIKAIVLIFGLRLASAVIEPVSDKKMADLLYSTSKALTLLVVILLGFAFLGFIVIMLIVYTCNFGVL